jgi:predicted unusual protein kinase regulating ubiquinone biosynthesis (AarF/ABC1/UbiB family)
MRHLAQLIVRACHVIWATRVILPTLIAGRPRRDRAQALRAAFESLGGSWIKLGQALALRFDLWPVDYCRELLVIRNEPKPLAYSSIRQIVASEFGEYPEQTFASFDTEPFSITSSGQLHLASTRDGARLVVKVQDRSIRRDFVIDAELMRLLASIGAFRLFEIVRGRDTIEEFIRSRAIELSLEAGRANAERMTALAAGDAWEFNARIRPEWTTDCVLTWDFVDGIPVSQIVEAKRQSKRDYLDDLAERGYDPDRIARRIYWNALNQIFRDGIFHADVSPAGLLVLPADKIAYVDFAVIGRLSEERQNSLRYFWRCLLQQRFEAAIDEMLYCIGTPASYDAIQFRRDLIRVLEDYVDGFHSPATSEPRRTAHQHVAQIMSVIRQHRLPIPAELASYFTTMLTTESIVFDLSPSIDAAGEVKAFFNRAASLDVEEALRPQRAYASVVGFHQQARLMLSELRTIQKTSQSIEISLRTLRIRLLQYGFWAVLIVAAAYLAVNNDTLNSLQSSLGLQPHWTAAALLVFALFLVSRIWRQGRQLAAIDRSIVTARELSNRSLGRVR